MADLSRMLPPGPREKFITLRDQAADRIAVARHAGDEMEAQRVQISKHQFALDLYLRNPKQTHEEVARLEAKIAEAKAELLRIGENREARTQRSQPIGRLVNRIEAYITSTDPRSISLFDGALPKRAKGTSASEAVATARNEIEELMSKLEGIDNAPLPASEVKARVSAFVKNLAVAGEPEIDGLLAGFDEVRWPTNFVLVGERGFEAVNVPAMMAWMFGDQMIKKLNAMIDQEAAEQDGAVAAKDRPKLRGQIHDALLLASRIEEAAISEAAAGGMEIDRRGAADPRAVLGIVGPRPRDEL